MKIKVCFCIDENYVDYLGAVLLSLIESNKHNKVDVYIIFKDITDESISKLRKPIDEIYNFNVFFINSTDNNISNLRAGGHISAATYIRFEIPSLLPNLTKVLYLDSDLLVLDDLSELWETNIHDYYVAAVENPFFDRFKSLNMNEKMGYFNAGVLLINLKKWREDNIKNRAIVFLKEYKSECKMYDQDALNSVISGRWKNVDIRWNLQTVFLRKRKKFRDMKSKILIAYKNPGIVHFSSSSKPWNYMDPHPLTHKYKRYLHNFSQENHNYTIPQMLRGILKFIYVRIIYTLQLN